MLKANHSLSDTAKPNIEDLVCFSIESAGMSDRCVSGIAWYLWYLADSNFCGCSLFPLWQIQAASHKRGRVMASSVHGLDMGRLAVGVSLGTCRDKRCAQHRGNISECIPRLAAHPRSCNHLAVKIMNSASGLEYGDR